MNEIDSRTLLWIAAWEDDPATGSSPISTGDLATRYGFIGGDMISFARSVARLVEGGFVTGVDATSHSSSFTEYLIRGLTLHGRDEIEKLGAKVLAAPAASEGGTPSTTTVIHGNVDNRSVSVTNSGQFAGNVGGAGDASEPVFNQQQIGEVHITELTELHRSNPEVKAILESPGTNEDRTRKLTALLGALGGLATDVAAKVATNLLQGG